MYSCGPLHMDEQGLCNQLEPTNNSSVLIQDVAWKTWWEWWMSGKSGSGKCIIAACYDDILPWNCKLYVSITDILIYNCLLKIVWTNYLKSYKCLEIIGVISFAIFANMRYNPTALDAFAEIVKVMNLTGMWCASLPDTLKVLLARFAFKAWSIASEFYNIDCV